MAGVPTVEGQSIRAKILSFMVTFNGDHGYMPTIAEIAERFGMHRTSVIWHLSVLRAEGEVWYQDGKVARSLKLGRIHA